VQNLVLDENAEDAKNNQDNQTDEEHAITGGEVIFGLWEEDSVALLSPLSALESYPCTHKRQRPADTNLQRKDDHCEAHKCCNAHCHDH